MKITKRILAAVLCICMVWVAGLSLAVSAEEQPYRPITGVELDKNKLSLHYGETYKFKVTVSPSDPDSYSLVWKSSNEKLATVDSNGKVTIAAATDDTPDLAQTVTITVSVSGNSSIKDSCNITVSKKVDPADLFGRIFNAIVTVFTALFVNFKDPAMKAGQTLIDFFKQMFGSSETTVA